MLCFYWLDNVANRYASGSHYQGFAGKRKACKPLCVLTLKRQGKMMRTVKKVANSYNCESLGIANPSFLSLKNRGLANPSKVANREYCESLRAQFGWEWTFYIYSMFGIVFAVIWLLYFRNSPREMSWISQGLEILF